MSRDDDRHPDDPGPRSGGIPLPMAPPARNEGPAVAGPEAGAPTDAADGAHGPDRRTVLKWMALAAAVPAVGGGCAPDAEPGPGGTVPAAGGSAGAGGADAPARVGNPKAAGTPWDPDLIAPRRHWDLVLTDDERQGLAALCDVILPADEGSPSASEVGVVDFIDEWVSAPYDGQRADLVRVRGGLVWLDREAEARFGDGRRFRDLDDASKAAICDDLCWLAEAAPEHRSAARFFARIRDLASTAFYTTPQGMADIGYVGNTALARWGPPPPEVLRHLGLA